MIIELKPEDEQLIQKRLQSGAFTSVEQVIHQAQESLDADETWLEENKDEIQQKISKGLAQLAVRDFPLKIYVHNFKRKRLLGKASNRTPREGDNSFSRT